MDEWSVAVVAALVLAFSLVSGRLASAGVSSFMVFVAAGVALGPVGLGLLEEAQDLGPMRELFEVALMLVLFTDATSVRLSVLRAEDFLAIRVLAIGLPLTMLAGALVAWPLLPALGVWELVLVGVILAPTDAALGLPAISDRRVPGLVRRGLNVESGLNDGMALPFFTIVLAAAVETAAGGPDPVRVLVLSLVATPVLAAVIGAVGGRALAAAAQRGWAAEAWVQILALATATAAYASAASAGGSGFIAAWVAGLLFGRALREADPDGAATGTPTELAEVLGSLLATASFFLFGALLLGPLLEQITVRAVAYAVLSVTVVRMLPVALSLLGSGLRLPSVLFLGWFGPRGLASIVLALIAIEQGLPGADTLAVVMSVTIAVSVYAHGATAPWLAGRYGAWCAAEIAAAHPESSPAEPDRLVARLRPDTITPLRHAHTRRVR